MKEGLGQFRVLSDYEVHDPHPLILGADIEVKLIRNDVSWPGWVWVEVAEMSGWIPESHLGAGSGSRRRTLKAFNGQDLSGRRGEILTALEEAPGWIYATNANGDRGWFPLFNLKPHPQT